MRASRELTPSLLLAVCLVLVTSITAIANNQHNKKRRDRPPTRTEMKEAERRLSDMGYWTGPVDGAFDGTTRLALIAFQKMEGRKITGRLTRGELEAVMNASSPQARESGYKHVEVDVDRQVLQGAASTIKRKAGADSLTHRGAGSGFMAKHSDGRSHHLDCFTIPTTSAGVWLFMETPPFHLAPRATDVFGFPCLRLGR
jgi:hypothetical protein